MPFFNNKRKDFSIQPPKQQVDGTPFFVTDSANIDFTLANLNLSANLTQLLPTSGTYGSPTLIPILQIDQWGRITGVTTTSFSASGIALEVNGTPNLSQTILNLIDSATIEVVDLGGGNIEFNYIGTGGSGTVTSVSAGTGMSFTTIITSGSVDIDITKVPYIPAGFSTGLLKWDGTAWVFDNSTYLTTISGIAAGGDLSGTYVNPTVAKLRGELISTTTPTIGKILQYNGTEWAPANIPSGGSGGGGVFYYFNYQNYTGISPTTGLPTTPVPPSQLGITYGTISNSINSANLTNGSYTLVCGFVTIVGTPGITTIPAGLWDFNIWADFVGNTGGSNQTQFQIRVYKYDSSGAGTYTFISQSDNIFIYDPTVLAQYIGNVTMPQTTLLVTDRIYIEFWAQKNVNQSRQISFHFGPTTPSHVHTTIPSVTGTGLVKVVNSVFQSPATLLFNADVDANAAIAVNKLSMSTDRLLGRTTAGSGAVEEIQLTTNFTSGAATLSGGTLNIPQYSGGSGGITELTGDVTTPPASSGVTAATLKANLKTGSFGVTIDGITSVIQIGQVGYVVMPYDGTITRWTITSNVSGNIQFDIWKDAVIDTIPTSIDSIVGGVYPSITATNFGTSTILGSWTSTTFLAGHIFGFYVNSASTIKNATLTLRCTKT